MRQQYPSYHERVPKPANIVDPALALLNADYAMQDATKSAEMLIRDLLDGKLDDMRLRDKYLREAEHLLSALTAAVTLLKGAQTK